jgi:hypothetical protein
LPVYKKEFEASPSAGFLGKRNGSAGFRKRFELNRAFLLFQVFYHMNTHISRKTTFFLAASDNGKRPARQRFIRDGLILAARSQFPDHGIDVIGGEGVFLADSDKLQDHFFQP